MSQYIRPKIPNPTVFCTVCLADRSQTVLVDEVDRLRIAVHETRAKHPFEILAWVTLPDHLHCVLQLQDDTNLGLVWASIKGKFTRAIRRPGLGPAPLPTDLPIVQSGRYAGLKPGLRVNKRETAIWQRRFWEHHIRNDRDLQNHIRYCWGNPVKHGLCDRPTDWPFSSIHRDVRNGVAQPDWIDTATDLVAGEP